jgi:hypothetical protein
LLADGGKLVALDDRYYAVWIPDGFYGASTRVVIYDLHGTSGYPEAEWNDWHALLKTRGYALVGLAWDGGTADADADRTVYERFQRIDAALSGLCPITGASKWVMGFSVGSALSFAIMVRDVAAQKLFLGNVANSGSAWNPRATGKDVMHPTVEAARANPVAYQGARSFLYCGEKDFDHGWSMCDEMLGAKEFVQAHGGSAVLYQDPNGTHGGLPRNPDSAREVLDYVAR